MARFPFGIPNSWYLVAYSDELGMGDVLSLPYLGRSMVAFRDESGSVSVLDGYCPHLGANLAVGASFCCCPGDGSGDAEAGWVGQRGKTRWGRGRRSDQLLSMYSFFRFWSLEDLHVESVRLQVGKSGTRTSSGKPFAGLRNIWEQLFLLFPELTNHWGDES